MTAENSVKISYRDVLQRVAKRHDLEITHFPTVTAQILAEDAAALRQLAALIEEAEQWNGSGHSGPWILQRLQFGFGSAIATPTYASPASQRERDAFAVKLDEAEQVERRLCERAEVLANAFEAFDAAHEHDIVVATAAGQVNLGQEHRDAAQIIRELCAVIRAGFDPSAPLAPSVHGPGE